MYRVAQKVNQYLRIIIKSYEKPSMRLAFLSVYITKWAQEFYYIFLIKYYVLFVLCDLYVTQGVAVFRSCNMGDIDVFDKIATKKQKQEKIW